MFLPLSVGQRDSSETGRQMFMKFFFEDGIALATNFGDFGADQDHDPDLGIFNGIFTNARYGEL